MKVPGLRRLLLRAEVRIGGGHFVAHTLTVSESTVFIETDRPLPVGSPLVAVLSFPKWVEETTLHGRVTNVVVGHNAGDASGIEVEIEAPDQQSWAEVLASLDAAASNAPPPNRYRVLLVEDNDLIQDMFAYGVDKYFRGRSARVVVDIASDGGQAWSMLQSGGYDLAIVDHYLPVLDGSNLLTRLRREPKLSTLPVVGISIGGRDVREAMLDAGADLFLSKPIVLRDLFNTLERLAAVQPGEVPA